MKFKSICFVLFLFSIACSVFGQEEISLQLDWGQPKLLHFEDETVIAPNIEGQELDNGKPIFFWKQQVKSGRLEISLSNFQYAQAPAEEKAYLNRFSFSVPEVQQYSAKVTKEEKSYAAVVYLFPYVKINGVVQRLVSFDVSLEQSTSSPLASKSFALNSVLKEGSGQWYKIAVKKDGVYKIDRDFLQECGIDVQSLNPQSIHIYGNGFGKLPELNATPRPDDLIKNAITIFGEGDGSFDNGDYILFYVWGPSRWYDTTATEFELVKNIYSDNSYYFININPAEPPLRIQSFSGNTLIPNQTVTSYSYHDIYENDLVNLVGGGQRWYADLFDTELTKIFNFFVPNIVSSSPARFRTAIATNAPSSAGTQQTYSVNGTILSSTPLPGVSSDYVRSTSSLLLANPSSSLPLKISITRNSPSTVVYLDRILLNARRSLFMMNQQFNFRDLNSVGAGAISEFQLTGLPQNGFVWDVSNRQKPVLMQGTNSGSYYSFVVQTDTIKEFVASDGFSFLQPDFFGAISPQNLHGMDQAELLIVTHKSFVSQANRLADLHRSTGMTVNVATTEQIYNEFSSGMLDATAIRMFAKMFYDRATTSNDKPKHLLLFGDGTYDPKNRVSGNNNFVPTYQVESSENHINALVTDDYYGMMDDVESIEPTDLLDIGVGRLLISDNAMAKEQVDKIEHYLKNGSGLFSMSTANCMQDAAGQSSTFGDWRLNYVQIADDEEGGYFINSDTEPQYNFVTVNNPEMNCDKLYCDAFTQVITAGGERYPDVYNAITNRIERGALVVNYVGHGGEVGVAEERIITIPQIQSWANVDKLNLFVSATCEFTKYDDPSRVSAGEWVSLNPYGGAIALMTTTRSVFFGVNTITGQKFFENVFDRDANNDPLTFGEIIRLTKNAAGSSDNKRSFTLIGDPALKIALPRLRIVADSINGHSPEVYLDTVRALSKMRIKAHVEDFNGNTLNSFNGKATISIFDKPKTLQTLGQNDDSPVIPYQLQRNIIYRGQSTITNGFFECTFIVPKDINYAYGNGKISFYAENSNTDASGQDKRFLVGGIDSIGINDITGPQIDLFLNDENFVSNGLTDETPVLLANIFDENGINTVGNGIGHDITAILDGKTAEPIILNEYYTADLDSYQSGKLRYNFAALEPGRHTLQLKVWDVNNNSSQTSIDFIVQKKELLTLSHVLNYPNPFTTKTDFYFEHNQVCSQLETQIQIFTVSGRLVKTINEMVSTEGYRSAGITWDGRDDYGDQLAKGVYVYIMKVRSPEGVVAEKTEKLVLLK
jgi:hypothetical protein